VQEQRAVADRSREFKRLLDLRDRTSLSTTAADIIASGATVDFRTVTIDKGAREGLRPIWP
jgi:cell shape-determining protein MreC